MRKLVLILIASIAVITLIRALDHTSPGPPASAAVANGEYNN